jgi:hypothetical protein
LPDRGRETFSGPHRAGNRFDIFLHQPVAGPSGGDLKGRHKAHAIFKEGRH